jgi:hypothetical protein
MTLAAKTGDKCNIDNIDNKYPIMLSSVQLITPLTGIERINR